MIDPTESIQRKRPCGCEEGVQRIALLSTLPNIVCYNTAAPSSAPHLKCSTCTLWLLCLTCSAPSLYFSIAYFNLSILHICSYSNPSLHTASGINGITALLFPQSKLLRLSVYFLWGTKCISKLLRGPLVHLSFLLLVCLVVAVVSIYLIQFYSTERVTARLHPHGTVK